MSFYAYILECADGSYYTGHTEDLTRRIAEHDRGIKCVYTSSRRPVHLVWFQEFGFREEAKRAEAQIKRWNRKKKQALIGKDFKALSKAAKKYFTNKKTPESPSDPE